MKTRSKKLPPRPILNARGEPYKPGDLFLDKYMPNATDEERAEARENLEGFADAILKILHRQEVEKRKKEWEES